MLGALTLSTSLTKYSTCKTAEQGRPLPKNKRVKSYDDGIPDIFHSVSMNKEEGITLLLKNSENSPTHSLTYIKLTNKQLVRGKYLPTKKDSKTLYLGEFQPEEIVHCDNHREGYFLIVLFYTRVEYIEDLLVRKGLTSTPEYKFVNDLLGRSAIDPNKPFLYNQSDNKYYQRLPRGGYVAKSLLYENFNQSNPKPISILHEYFDDFNSIDKQDAYKICIEDKVKTANLDEAENIIRKLQKRHNTNFQNIAKQ